MLMHKMRSSREKKLSEVKCPLCRGDYNARVLIECADGVLTRFSKQGGGAGLPHNYGGLFMRDEERLDYILEMRRNLANLQFATLGNYAFVAFLLSFVWFTWSFFFRNYAQRYYYIMYCLCFLLHFVKCIEKLHLQARKHFDAEKIMYAICALDSDFRHRFMLIYVYFLGLLVFWLRIVAITFTLTEIIGVAGSFYTYAIA